MGAFAESSDFLSRRRNLRLQHLLKLSELFELCYRPFSSVRMSRLERFLNAQDMRPGLACSGQFFVLFNW